MKSSWYELKSAAILLRESGNSIRFIEKNLGIPRSTLSGWFKDVELSKYQLERLNQNKLDNLTKANLQRASILNKKKQKNELKAKEDALKAISNIDIGAQIHVLLLAVIYMNNSSSHSSNRHKILQSKDPRVLEYIVNTLVRYENVDPSEIKISLKLSTSHSRVKEIDYWCRRLNLLPSNFIGISVDNRYRLELNLEDHGQYSMVCHNVALINKLVYLNKLFYERVL